MKVLLLVVSLAGLYACQSNTYKDEQMQQAAADSTKDTTATPETKKFFVLTSWSTTDRNKALAHIPNQQKQLMGLWQKGVVENVYYNQKGKFNDDQPLSLIAFFINASSEDQARMALDTTDIVKSNLANYTLRPVGEQVFGRNDKAMKLASTTDHVYAVIWAFLVDRTKLDTKILDEQKAFGKKLEQEGIIENGYIDLSSLSSQTNDTQPGIYFINAKSEADAKKIIDDMPMIQAKQATYGLRDIGQFFIGKKE